MSDCDNCGSEIVGTFDEVEVRIGNSEIDRRIERRDMLTVMSSMDEKVVKVTAQAMVCSGCGEGSIILNENVPFAQAFHDEDSEKFQHIAEVREEERSRFLHGD